MGRVAGTRVDESILVDSQSNLDKDFSRYPLKTEKAKRMNLGGKRKEWKWLSSSQWQALGDRGAAKIHVELLGYSEISDDLDVNIQIRRCTYASRL